MTYNNISFVIVVNPGILSKIPKKNGNKKELNTVPATNFLPINTYPIVIIKTLTIKRVVDKDKGMKRYSLVKDNRSLYESSNPKSILDGDLDDCVYAYLKYLVKENGNE